MLGCRRLIATLVSVILTQRGRLSEGQEMERAGLTSLTMARAGVASERATRTSIAVGLARLGVGSRLSICRPPEAARTHPYGAGDRQPCNFDPNTRSGRWQPRTQRFPEKVGCRPSRTCASIRQLMGKSQSQMAQLLGISTRAVQSYQQGWRGTPPSVQKNAMLQLYLHRRQEAGPSRPCWQVCACTPEERAQCPAWLLQEGQLCWLTTGNGFRGSTGPSTWARPRAAGTARP